MRISGCRHDRWHGLSRGRPLFCLSQSTCSPLILRYFFSAWSSHQWGGFPGCKLFFFSSSLPGARVSPRFHFRFFPIVPPSYIETFPALAGMWGLLLVFCTCSVRTVLFEDVSLMYLWEKLSSLSCYSAILLGSPPWAVFKNQIYFKRQRFNFHLQPRWSNRDWIILSLRHLPVSVLYKREGRG